MVWERLQHIWLIHMQCMNQEGSRFGGEPTSLIKQSYTKKMTMDIQIQDNF